jgi:hypothetical protein
MTINDCQKNSVFAGLDPAIHGISQCLRELVLYQKALTFTLCAAPWMAGSSPAMTVIYWNTEDFVIAGLDPAIHGIPQCLRELVYLRRKQTIS